MGLLLHSLGSTVVDGQGMPCQAMLLFQLGVEHVEPGKGLAAAGRKDGEQAEKSCVFSFKRNL